MLPILVQVRMRYSVTPPIGSTSLRVQCVESIESRLLRQCVAWGSVSLRVSGDVKKKLLVQASQQGDSGSAVHERLKQPQHRSCRRLGGYVRELVLRCDVLEVDEPESHRVADRESRNASRFHAQARQSAPLLDLN